MMDADMDPDELASIGDMMRDQEALEHDIPKAAAEGTLVRCGNFYCSFKENNTYYFRGPDMCPTCLARWPAYRA